LTEQLSLAALIFGVGLTLFVSTGTWTWLWAYKTSGGNLVVPSICCVHKSLPETSRAYIDHNSH